MLTNKDYCDYDTCVALKELGFNQYNSIRYYAGVGGVKLWDFDGEPNYKEGELIALNDLYGVPRDGNEVAAPSLYEAQKFLREDKQIVVLVGFDFCPFTSEIVYNWVIVMNGNTAKKSSYTYDYFEESLAEGIKATVKILKEK